MKITWPQILAGALAISPLVAEASAKSQIHCATRLGLTSTHPVPTKSHVVTVRVTATVIFTPVKTVTPPPKTYTKTKTKTITVATTLDQITDTVSKTKTVTTTDTITKSITITKESIVTTTVTNTDTTTVSTSSGFTPAGLQTTVSPSAPVRARTAHVEERAPKYRQTCTQGADGHPTLYPKLYPTAVVCKGIVKIIQTTTRTAKHTKTVTCKPPPAKTVTSTVSRTVTTTITPAHAVVTDYFYTTVGTTTDVYITTTTTTTTTTTETVLDPVATYYAACGPDNSLGAVNGQNVYGFATNNPVSQIAPSFSSYDCCLSCLTSPTCGAGVLFSGANLCFLVATLGTCDPKVSVLNYLAGGGGPQKDFVSTSNCGAVYLSPP